MSGHSKWSQIKRQKQIKDVARGNTFTKLSRAITLAVIEGGRVAEPENNLKLRLAIGKARELNMPKDNIKRAIEHGMGLDNAQIKEVVYEGFGPAGVALVIIAATDNPNRTSAEVRNILSDFDGKMATPGAVSYLFRKCAKIVFDKKDISEENVFEFVSNIEAFDIEQNDEYYIVYFPFENLGKAGLDVEIIYKPLINLELKSDEQQNKVLELIKDLKNLDDVQNVFVNLEI